MDQHKQKSKLRGRSGLMVEMEFQSLAPTSHQCKQVDFLFVTGIFLYLAAQLSRSSLF